MQVLEIVALALGTERAWRLAPSREHLDKARGALERVGVGELGKRGYGELSGGERQRVLLARALALEPDVLALDEPTSQLDPGGTERILDLVDRLHAERDLTVLLVSHDLSLVARRASHAFAVVHGKCAAGPASSILTSETLTRLYEYPMTVVREGAAVAIVPGSPS
jgi:ABC-type Mn2+/Zn2+ transport system ATPase subunit